MHNRERQALIREETSRVDGQTPSAKGDSDKHRKMAANHFRFMRGAAQIYYADLASGLLEIPQVVIPSILKIPLSRLFLPALHFKSNH